MQQLYKQHSYQNQGQYQQQSQSQSSSQAQPGGNMQQQQQHAYITYNQQQQQQAVQQNSLLNQHQHTLNQMYSFAPHPNSFASYNSKENNNASKNQNRSGKNIDQNDPNQHNYNNHHHHHNLKNNGGGEYVSSKSNNYHNNSQQQQSHNIQQQQQYLSGNTSHYHQRGQGANQQSQRNFGDQQLNQQHNLNYGYQQQGSSAKQHQYHYNQSQQQQQQHQQQQQQQQQQKQVQQGNQQQQEQGLQQQSSYSSSSSSSSSQLSQNNQQQQRYKTHKCRHFLSGNCTLGERCNFAHSDRELRDPQDPIPQNVQVGQKVQITNFKTVKCRYYDNGYCKNSEKCSFAHGNVELLTPGVTLNNINTFPQQNQLQICQIQKEEMRKESLEQQSNTQYYKNNMNDVISELKYSFPNNTQALKQLDEAVSHLEDDNIEKAHKVIQDLFDDSQRTTQEKQHILSIFKKFNDHYKIKMETKYKSESSGFSQSSFFQHTPFEGFSLEFQNAYMNGMNNNLDTLAGANEQESLQQSFNTNHKSISSSNTINSHQNSSSLQQSNGYPIHNFSSQSNVCQSLNNNNNGQQLNNYCHSSSCSNSEHRSFGSISKKDYSPGQLHQISNNLQVISDNNANNGSGESDYNLKCFGFEDDQEKWDYQAISDLNKNFKNLAFENTHNDGSLDYTDSEMLEKKQQIQDIFSCDNSNLIIFKNSQKTQAFYEEEFLIAENESILKAGSQTCTCKSVSIQENSTDDDDSKKPQA